MLRRIHGVTTNLPRIRSLVTATLTPTMNDEVGWDIVSDSGLGLALVFRTVRLTRTRIACLLLVQYLDGYHKDL